MPDLERHLGKHGVYKKNMKDYKQPHSKCVFFCFGEALTRLNYSILY